MILQDFVMLGKTIPEPSSDGRVFVCSAGVSPELRRLVRVYPLARGDAPRRWSICTVSVERNSRDSRDESFRLQGDRSKGSHERINKVAFAVTGTIAREHRARLLDPFKADSIDELNARRASLGFLEPIGEPSLTFEFREDAPDSPQLSLFAQTDEEAKKVGAKRFAYQPYLSFRDLHGWHRLQLRDWGAYEFMRKYGDERRDELREACRLHERPCLLVGNMNHQRNAWLVISVLFPISQLVLTV